jgi:FAD/FMN-containing dehydrogenase
LRLLPIRDGWDVLDNNLLACPREHVEAVFAMLKRQPNRPKFTGGLEAARLRPWHVEWFLRLKPDAIWTAYDSADDWDALVSAVWMLTEAGIVGPHRRKRTGAYVLMGRRGDTPDAAEARLASVIRLGIKTQAMLFDNGRECRPEDMKRWWALRKKYTAAAEVGAMVAETWSMPNDNNDASAASR